jgi:hypothetical protein
MNLEEVQKRLGIVLPDRHKAAMTDPTDPIHGKRDFLVPESPYEALRWVETNEFLHDQSGWDPWPHFLVAFASAGCGDYFAYDLRSEPNLIIYMDPDKTVEENLDLGADDKLKYDSFDEWYEDQFVEHDF